MTINTAFKSMMQSDLAAMMGDWSESLTYSGGTISGTYSPIDSGNDIAEEGILQTASAQFVCNTDTFDGLTVKPAVRDTVTVAGIKYYIMDIVRDPACVTINLRRN